MFGDLFTEQSAKDSAARVSFTRDHGPGPPKPRSMCRFVGIDNQGATCYLNSLLQTLLLTPEFKERLFKLSENELGSLNDADKIEAKVRVIPIQLQRLFAQLLLSNRQSVSTLDLTNSFGWTNQEGFQQHDVQELNRILFCAIEESLVGTPGQDIINQLYRGTFVNQIKCLRCKKVSEREEDFLDLTLTVAGMSGVEAALKSSYCDVEVMNGRNQYRCESCGILTDANKGAKLRNLPPILTLSLLRFSFDLVKMTRYKENGRFTFPMHLDMSNYCDENSDQTEKDKFLYDLFSVVVHRGGAHGGHYFAYIRDIDSLGLWQPQQEDSKEPKQRDLAATGLNIIECESPVDLIENILSQEPDQAMSIDRLCGEISKVTGVSWNKRFKKSYGPINKFLRSSDMFCYNTDSNWISLAAIEGPSASIENSKSKTPECLSDSCHDMKGMASTSTDVEQNDTAENPDDHSGHHWFCFNDSNVSAINAKEIDHQFSGKESAYMLFYRSRSLQRPKEAQGQSSYTIPPRLIQEVEMMNDGLMQQRQDHDQKINLITLKIYKAEHFVCRELLYLKDTASGENSVLELSIDRRKTVLELKRSLQEMLKNSAIQNPIVHIIKEFCDGFYLDLLINDDESVLQDMNLTNNTCLLIWDGYKIDEQVVEGGPGKEPMKLLAVSQADQEPVGEIILLKSRSLSQMYEAVAKMVAVDISKLYIQHNVGESTVLLPPDPHQSLVEAGLSNDDIVVLTTDTECSKSSHVKKYVWTFEALNQLSGDSDITPINLKVESSLGVAELKDIVMEKFGVSGSVSPETVRLRGVHPTLGVQPPLHEGLSLQDAGLHNDMSVVLEEGRPPQESEMTISINKLTGGKLVQRREFVVDRQLTGEAMLQAACQLMDCQESSSQWYLSKTDMHGDASDPLEDDTTTLMEQMVNDGDTLILKEGSAVKKDQVCLNVMLHTDHDECVLGGSTPSDRGDNHMVNGENEEDKIMLELAAKLSTSDHVDPLELNPLSKWLCPTMQRLFDKSLIVNKNMSIEELKQALMSTECFQTLRIPTSNFMRLRVLEDWRPRAVVRNNSQVLRHTSAKDVLNLGVQILPQEEHLGNHELLLSVAHKIGGSRIYMPAKQFVWNTSGGQGAADLRRTIASRMKLPIHDVAIAKYNPNTFQWNVIKDAVQKQSKGKGKKKSGNNKCNVRQSPYYVQDGDLIGVKVISADKGVLDAEDFNSQEDLDQQLLLQQIAEEKRRVREEKKKEMWADGITIPFAPRHRPEVPLTIKVDKFS